ncbi:hypothetical protein [Nitrincola sp. A-D6]|uniref:hypothetical protein n=1 Tax=Nitrincola sp. A-D6 TaxID=1545442 RepID=UPI00068F11A6|nr:hypothetical protein [Nitrincola sp. A-D6]
MTRRALFSLLRTLLLTLLVMVLLLNVWFSQTRQENWQTPATVWIYPLNADDDPATQAWIDTLSDASFDDMEAFFDRESRRYRLGLEQPIQVNLAAQLDVLPPDIPLEPSIVDAVIWALKMRFWVWRMMIRFVNLMPFGSSFVSMPRIIPAPCSIRWVCRKD